MLYLVFYIDRDRFAMATTHVVEILPLVYWKEIVGAADGVVGLLNYHRAVVPVIDLSQRLTGRPSRASLNTRILMVRTAARDLDRVVELAGLETSVAPGLIGLVVERVTTTLRCEPSAFTSPPEMTDVAPWLGPVLTDANGIVQRIEVEQLLASYTLT